MGHANRRPMYNYHPINKEGREIRVLALLPKLSEDGLIQCRERRLALGSIDGHSQPGKI